jgi:hypothetical protein
MLVNRYFPPVGTTSVPPHPPPATGREGDPHPHPSALPPHLQNHLPPSFFLTPDQFLETSRRQQGGTPHSGTWGIPPTRSDRDPFRDRVRGPEYNDLPPHLRHMRGYPTLCPVPSLRRRAHPGSLSFAWKMRGYSPFGALRCPPTRSKRGTPQDPCRGSGLLRPAPPTYVHK